jgi:hypothetical protein
MFFASRSFRSLRSRKKAIPPLTEATAHLLEIHSGDVDEPSLCVEASLEEQAVPVGMEPAEGSRRLEYEDTGAAQRAAGGLGNEVAYQGVDEATDLAVQPLVVAEEDAQHLGKREDEPLGGLLHRLSMRQPQQELLVHVLAQKQGALLRTGRAEAVQWPAQGMEHAAAERAKVLQSAIRVCTLDSGDAPAIVTAGQEALNRLADPLETELPELLGELGLVAGEEFGEVSAEEPLERACSPLAVGARGRRIQGQRQLVCHALLDDPPLRAA